MNPQSIDEPFEKLLEHLRDDRGIDFTGYKRASLHRRINKRMRDVGFEDVTAYLDYLQVDPVEYTGLLDTILINVTSFFRDGPPWDYVDKDVLPRILEAKKAESDLRFWSAGCASGQEPLSLAMLLAEHLGPDEAARRVKIYATDLDEDALATARSATYSNKDLERVPQELRKKYFTDTEGGFAFDPTLRRTVIYGRHDVVNDAPISRLDMLLCRNTFMYFNADVQKRVLARFHYALNDPGFLFLGGSEMLLSQSSLFEPVNAKQRVFVRRPAGPGSNREGGPGAGKSLDKSLRELAFEQVPVATLVVGASGNLEMANSSARRLFGVKLEDIGRPFQDLEVSYRPLELRGPIDRVRADSAPAFIGGIGFTPDGASPRLLDFTLVPVRRTGSRHDVLICAADVTNQRKLEDELERSSHELETAYEELQATNEELETSNEELQSTVEELETTNEEIQSSNEELETMNEELQSTNEELQTLNDELRSRTMELDRAKGFMESLLSNLQLGMGVIDRGSKILEWNRQAEEMWGVRPDEAIGASLLALDVGLPVDQLAGPIKKALTNAGDRHEFDVRAVNRRGRSLNCRITLIPLHTDDHESAEGVILLMDTTSSARSPSRDAVDSEPK